MQVLALRGEGDGDGALQLAGGGGYGEAVFLRSPAAAAAEQQGTGEGQDSEEDTALKQPGSRSEPAAATPEGQAEKAESGGKQRHSSLQGSLTEGAYGVVGSGDDQRDGRGSAARGYSLRSEGDDGISRHAGDREGDRGRRARAADGTKLQVVSRRAAVKDDHIGIGDGEGEVLNQHVLGGAGGAGEGRVAAVEGGDGVGSEAEGGDSDGGGEAVERRNGKRLARVQEGDGAGRGAADGRESGGESDGVLEEDGVGGGGKRDADA